MMVARERKLPRPTTAELEILQVLWERGTCTVRDVHEVLHRHDGTGYTTALKQLQIMFDKGLVERDESQRAHVYRAAVSKERTQKKFLSDMLQRVFEGSASQLMMHALAGHRASSHEIEELRRVLDAYREDDDDGAE